MKRVVEHVRDTLGRDVVTESLACRVLGQAASTQRWRASLADDEPHLGKRIAAWMAREYGRYGYRGITAFLRAKGWWVHHKRVERFWRLEGQKVPAKSRSGEGSGVDLGMVRASGHGQRTGSTSGLMTSSWTGRHTVGHSRC